ncbi:MAG TPA: tetratricopeptide repeat protein, partial [Thermodesulfobacteriota bacterium]|nr:tetratricopeptide repeat protein [Thermodesulfobacteriota bacterium]
MHTQSLLIRRLIALFVTLLVYYCSDPETFASSWPESVKQLDVGKISSIAQMKTAIDLLSMSSSQALKNNSFTPGLQELLLTKSGECISRLAALHEKMHHVSDKDKQEEKDSFLANREILKKIFDLNTEIIREIEEKRLDKMKDPSAFFKTPEWQQPQHLIFLSSYWVGWNGYYASLLFSEDDPLRKTLLDEAIKGFSWAFIDFQKDAFIVKSLFGRGLCYKQIKDYQNALNDFRSVRKKTNKDDSLYWRCRFEEALVTYQAGNLEQTSRDLDEMEKEMTRSKIPDNIVAGVKELKAQVLFTLSGKQAEPGQRETEKPDETFQQRTFSELKQLSVKNKSVVDELYQYAQKHADHLDQLSYAELGPIAAMAMGDRYFAEKDYDKAIPYYLPISADAQSPFKHRLDVLWFRLAYCYCKQRQWGNALPYLENFRNKFPKSSLIQQALSLYYAAAFNIYNTHPTTGNYEKYIDSIQSYLNGCRTCPDRGEAHFQLGKYYQKKGQNDKALNEYLLVGKGAPNYPAARFLVLQSDVDTLESLRNKGQYRSKDAIALYHEAVRLLEECRTIDLARKGTAIQNEI